MPRVILHSDLNAFYASVELLHRPALRGKPMAVGGDEQSRHGIVLSKTDEAKKTGIITGESLVEARAKCPGLITLPPNYRLYLRMAQLVREIYAGYTDQCEPFGLDESWLDVTASAKLFGSGRTVADEIRARVRRELGLTVSVGVSFNKIFAKLGSDYKKPNATTVISPENFRELVWPLPAKELLYVGPATAAKLRARGKRTIGDIANTDEASLVSWLGKWGGMLHSFANGYDAAPVSRMGESSLVKSIGNSSTCPRDLTCDDDVLAMLYVLGESVASRLRESGLEATTVQITVRDNALQSFVRQCRLARPTHLVSELVDSGMRLFRAHYDWQSRLPLRSIGIRGADLVPAGAPGQTGLFFSEQRRDKRERLEATTDHLRNRYGHFALQRAFLLVDRKLANIDAKRDHVIHPVGYTFGGSEYVGN